MVMYAKRKRKSPVVQPSPAAEEEKTIISTPSSQEDIDAEIFAYKKSRTQTCFTDNEKLEIVEFLKLNPCIYQRQLADYKNLKHKYKVWKAQSDKMGTTVKELQTFYNSMRSKLGRLKLVAKKKGQNVEMFTPTEKWIWEKFQFLAPHIIEIKVKKGSNLQAKAIIDVFNRPSTAVVIPVEDVESQTSQQPSKFSTPSFSELAREPTPAKDDILIGSVTNDMLAKRQPTERKNAGTYFAMYVENTLEQLPAPLRRHAELSILQVLHECEERLERERGVIH